MTDRAALLVKDLERVPAVLRRQAAASSPDVSGPGHHGDGRIVLTGLGSSRFAALAIAPILAAAGTAVVVEHASTARPAPVGPGTLVVAISSSGATRETVAAAGRAREAGARVLAITNRPTSPLTAAADGVLELEAGEEASGVASATFTATVAALLRLAGALGAPVDAPTVIAAAAEAAADALANRHAWLASAADILGGGAPIHVIGDASALGTVEQAALLFRECPRLDADATDAGDWLHVGIYTALPGYRALLLAGTPYDEEIVRTIHGRGGRMVAVGPPLADADLAIALPGACLRDPVARALVEPIVAASLAAELWRRVPAAWA